MRMKKNYYIFMTQFFYLKVTFRVSLEASTNHISMLSLNILITFVIANSLRNITKSFNKNNSIKITRKTGRRNIIRRKKIVIHFHFFTWFCRQY